MFTATDNGSFLALEVDLSLANLSLVGLTGRICASFSFCLLHN